MGLLDLASQLKLKQEDFAKKQGISLHGELKYRKGSVFTSQRRHTRCGRDWSSVVCSSDLPTPLRTVARWRTLCRCHTQGSAFTADVSGPGDRKSVVSGKSVDLGGRRII